MIIDFDFEEDEERLEDDLMRKVCKFNSGLLKILKYIIKLKMKVIMLTLVKTRRSEYLRNFLLKKQKKKLRLMRRKVTELQDIDWQDTSLATGEIIKVLSEMNTPPNLEINVFHNINLEKEIRKMLLQIELTYKSYEYEETIF